MAKQTRLCRVTLVIFECIRTHVVWRILIVSIHKRHNELNGFVKSTYLISIRLILFDKWRDVMNFDVNRNEMITRPELDFRM